ncbi:hypothetical protein [Methylorubrum zatmanii]|uniref:HK97 gp10 family phage protein n=1 Tax=Methylorubrum zatmanii TaxID=29429 RepID=A0ABW1WVN7_9HYPH|nr:hypothetical protein [Methylorubrum zatmanii]MBD8909782.1 hypothetical protein [Methylorubrum zatmanii]
MASPFDLVRIRSGLDDILGSYRQMAKRRSAYRWSVYRTDSFEVGGRKAIAYMARPSRRARPGEDGVYERNLFVDARGRTRFLPKVRNLGRPRPLLVAVERATYRPIAQQMFDAERERVVARAPALIEAELADAIAYNPSRVRRPARA